MVCCLLHACLVSVLSVSVSFWVVSCCFLFVHHFSMHFGLVVCLPTLGQRHDPYLFFGFHCIFFIVKGVTFHCEVVGVSGFQSLHFHMGGIVLCAAYSNCCP